MHSPIEESDDQLEETLSLCDLPLYSDQSADWDQDLSLASQEDYFEFFSHELNPSSAPPPENIIFCGKLIPYKETDIATTCELEINKRKRYWQLFRWKVPGRQEELSRGTTKKIKLGNKMPMFTASSSGKSKWYLLMFGISRFSPVVELRDIKSRQRSRRHQCPPSSPPQARGWGLWGLIIRVLSCGGNHQSTTVTAVSVDAYASPA